MMVSWITKEMEFCKVYKVEGKNGTPLDIPVIVPHLYKFFETLILQWLC